MVFEFSISDTAEKELIVLEARRIQREISLINEKFATLINENVVGDKLPLPKTEEFKTKIDRELYKALFEAFSTGNFTHEEFLKYLELIKNIIKKHIPDEKTEYTPFYQGKATNIFTEVNSKKTKHTIKEETGQMLFPLEELDRCSNSCITIPITNTLSVSSSKLFDYLVILLTNYLTYKKNKDDLQKFLTVDISVFDYMAKRGLKKKDSAIKQLKKDAETLFNARMTVTEQLYIGCGKRRKLEEHKSDIRILDKIPNKDDKIRDTFTVHIALSLAEYLTTHQVMQYPLHLLLTTNNNNVYYIGKRLVEHYNMNQFKTNKDSISVKSLLEHTPEIPTLAEEKNKNRMYRQHCIEPLENTLDQLQSLGILKEWHFMNENKNIIPQEKLEAYSLNFEEWNRFYIHFVLADYPETYKNKMLEEKKEKSKQ